MGHVYIICATGTNLYKIGRTDGSVEKRLQEIQGMSPVPLTLIASAETFVFVEIEAQLHSDFAGYRKHGEWFELDAEALQRAKEALQNYPKMVHLGISYRARKDWEEDKLLEPIEEVPPTLRQLAEQFGRLPEEERPNFFGAIISYCSRQRGQSVEE